MRKTTLIAVSAAAAALIAVPTIAGAQEEAPTDDTAPQARDFGHRRGGGEKIETIAEVLGLTTDELRSELAGGATVAELAEANGVSIDTVTDALLVQLSERVAEHVADGDFTQAEADERLADAEERIDGFVNGEVPANRGGAFGRGGMRGGHGGPGGHGMGVVSEALDLLGLEPSELMEQLQAGSTIAEIAEANGVSVDELVEAGMTAVTDRVTDAVANGDMTQDDADQIIADATERITEMITGEFSFGDREGGRRGPGGFGPGADDVDVSA